MLKVVLLLIEILLAFLLALLFHLLLLAVLRFCGIFFIFRSSLFGRLGLAVLLLSSRIGFEVFLLFRFFLSRFTTTTVLVTC